MTAAALEAATGIDDVVRVGIGRVRRLDKQAGFDRIAGGAHPMRGELLGEPVAPNLLGLPVVVRGHHRIGLRRECEGVRRIRNEAVDANTIVVDDATNQEGEGGESERAHLINPVISFSKVLFSHSSVRGKRRHDPADQLAECRHRLDRVCPALFPLSAEDGKRPPLRAGPAGRAPKEMISGQWMTV